MILPLEFRQGRETEKDEVGNPESTALISVQVQGIGLLFGKLSISYMWYKLYMEKTTHACSIPSKLQFGQGKYIIIKEKNAHVKPLSEALFGLCWNHKRFFVPKAAQFVKDPVVTLKQFWMKHLVPYAFIGHADYRQPI
uniref:Uncharacterized protein n=1 Tax=Solanum lycopersicum TaxID=4081 RepID=A0A3Q7I538_SOLLC